MSLCTVVMLVALAAPPADRLPDLPAAARVGEFDAPAVGRRLKYAVLLPADYDTSGKRYPALYLLHGYTGNYTSWLTYAQLPPTAAADHGLIVVMPDAGNSFYVNWHGAEGGRPNLWEDMITTDLVRHVDVTYRTVAGRAGRAVAGLSMGGYGAAVVGLRNPGLFAAVVTSGGALAVGRRAKDELRTGKADWNEPARWDHPTRPGYRPRGSAPRPSGRRRAGCSPPRSRPTPTTRSGWPSGSTRRRVRTSTSIAAPRTTGWPTAVRSPICCGGGGCGTSYLELPGGRAPPYWRDAARHWLLVVADRLGW